MPALDLASLQTGVRPHEQQAHKDGVQLREERLGLQHTLQMAFSKAADNPGTQCRRVWSGPENKSDATE